MSEEITSYEQAIAKYATPKEEQGEWKVSANQRERMQEMIQRNGGNTDAKVMKAALLGGILEQRQANGDYALKPNEGIGRRSSNTQLQGRSFASMRGAK